MSRDTAPFNPTTDLEHIPREPGVYLMKDRDGVIIYVGKANSLRSRLASYFLGRDERPFVERLETELHSIETVVTQNGHEALLLEDLLIKKHQPRYNARLKDDKSYLLVKVDLTDPWPRLETVRRRGRDRAEYLGPFPQGFQLKRLCLFLAGRLGLRVCSPRVFANRTRPCLQHHMGRCPAPCCGLADAQAYQSAMATARRILKGHGRDLKQELTDLMTSAAQELRFEEAARLRDLRRAMDELGTPQGVVGLGRLEADAIALERSETGAALQVLRIGDGSVRDTLVELFPGALPGTEELLASLVLQFYDARTLPQEIILGCAPEDAQLIRQALEERHQVSVEVTVPQKGRKLKLLEMAARNARMNLERWALSSDEGLDAMEELRGLLGLPASLSRVECFDISHLGAQDGVGSMSVAVDGVLQPSKYRVYHLREFHKDDYSMMAEVLGRYLGRLGDEPRLLLLDGGRAHLSMLAPLFAGLEDRVFLAAIAKARPEQGLASDRIYLPDDRTELPLAKDGPAFFLLQRLRDEAHRFGVKHHRIRRRQRTLKTVLQEHPGIGPARARRILQEFGSVEGLAGVTPAELALRAGLPEALATSLLAALPGPPTPPEDPAQKRMP
jgi:excinuclease ABC subunit C